MSAISRRHTMRLFSCALFCNRNTAREGCRIHSVLVYAGLVTTRKWLRIYTLLIDHVNYNWNNFHQTVVPRKLMRFQSFKVRFKWVAILLEKLLPCITPIDWNSIQIISKKQNRNYIMYCKQTFVIDIISTPSAWSPNELEIKFSFAQVVDCEIHDASVCGSIGPLTQT